MTDDGQQSGRGWDQHVYKVVTVAALMLIVVGTVAYRLLEDWSWVDSAYFSVVAVTTVGFGDLTPTSDSSKIFTIFYILSGIALITTYLNLRLKRRGMRAHNRS